MPSDVAQPESRTEGQQPAQQHSDKEHQQQHDVASSASTCSTPRTQPAANIGVEGEDEHSLRPHEGAVGG
eukprot:2611854-Pyramimonas_sp.AAC.1